MFNSEVEVKTVEDLLSGKFLKEIEGEYPSIVMRLNKRVLEIFIEARNKGGALFGVLNSVDIPTLLVSPKPGTLLCKTVEDMIFELNNNLK